MENKYVGYLLLGISVLVIFLILLFNSTLKEIIGTTCGETHDGEFCPMNQTVNQQTYIAPQGVLSGDLRKDGKKKFKICIHAHPKS